MRIYNASIYFTACDDDDLENQIAAALESRGIDISDIHVEYVDDTEDASI